jgi:uncharacterized protein YjaG (DUF416 family)
MRLPPYDYNTLRARLERLDERRQLAFGTVCCERLLPNYEAFSRDAGWGDVAPVRHALDRIWDYLGGATLAAKDADMALETCEAVVPDAEDHTSLYVTAAQDACFAVCALYDFILDPKSDHIADVTRFATDSVDLYVQEIEQMHPDDPQLEQKIAEHQLMQRELAQQERDLNAVSTAPSLDAAFLAALHHSWPHPGKSNLDLPQA